MPTYKIHKEEDKPSIYTNKPEFIGEPGYTYVGDTEGEVGPNPVEVVEGVEYAPEEGWNLESVVRAFPNAFNIDPEAAAAIDRGEKTELQKREEEAETAGMTLREYLSSDQGQMAAKYGRPPDSWNIPDYSEEGRNRYEQIVFKQIGGNPFQFDPNEEVEKQSAGFLPKLFDQVFQGQVLYQDRYKMTKKQRDHWEKEKNKYRAFVYNDAKAVQKKMVDEYEWMMDKFDRQAKEFQSAKDDMDKKANRRIDAFNPKTRVKRKMTIDEFNEAKAEDPNWTRGTPMAGKDEDGVTMQMLIDLAEFEMKIFHPDRLVNGRVSTSNLQHANRLRASLSLPPLEEIAGEELKDMGPVREWWDENMPGVLSAYTYREKVQSGGRSPETGSEVVRGGIKKGVATVGEGVTEAGIVEGNKTKAVNAKTGESYPEGFRASYIDPFTGTRYIVVVKDGYWDYE